MPDCLFLKISIVVSLLDLLVLLDHFEVFRYFHYAFSSQIMLFFFSLVIKEPGPYITARHIRFKFGSIPLGKTQNLCGATPPEGPSNRGSPYNQGGLSILEGGLTRE